MNGAEASSHLMMLARSWPEPGRICARAGRLSFRRRVVESACRRSVGLSACRPVGPSARRPVGTGESAAQSSHAFRAHFVLKLMERA